MPSTLSEVRDAIKLMKSYWAWRGGGTTEATDKYRHPQVDCSPGCCEGSRGYPVLVQQEYEFVLH